MKFTEALQSIHLVINSGSVPLLVGESGIGKTALIKQFAADYNYYYINIDGNLLKEGEIGGLPSVEKYYTNINEKKVEKNRTTYAVYFKFAYIDELLEKDPNAKILLFIDEINRCEHSVQQEIMNIILNREINGYKLNDNVVVVAAMNPSNKYDEFEDSEYQVVDMDQAQEDRFVWIYMESDVNEWLKWGMKLENGEPRIHDDVINFIASFPEYLHAPNSKESIKPTPRSWVRVSNIYREYLKEKGSLSLSILYNVVKGNVGAAISQDFLNYIEENKNPIIKPEEIFKNDYITDELKNRIKTESHSRLYLTARKVLFYLTNLQEREREISLFSEFLSYYPDDLKMGIMQGIKSDFTQNLYEDFLNNDIFIESFFSMYEDIEE
ncbi:MULTISPECIES: AAA family ATPase [Clostridium]|uniref:AAA family ATPase n=1 Tax=Clostridium TaxID=1485 RepID=UPI00069FFC60|nr:MULTISPECIES: AAA family ATPase [Clostridium]KOF56974.1 ATPase AAA [Clostridium sp. DMHC 10]MCD2345908.1 AAA family ATPase [Clostridium guangxiense]